MGVFSQRFEALEPSVVWSASLPHHSSWFIYTQMWGRVGPQCLLAVALPAPFAPQSATSLGPPAAELPQVFSALAARLRPSYQSG